MESTSKTPSTRLFVGGLPYHFTEGELLTLFAQFGRVVFIKIMHTPWGKSRGIGFVEFDNLESATAAKQKLHNYHVATDRTIIVDFAAPDPVIHPELRHGSQQSNTLSPRDNRSPFHQRGKPTGKLTAKPKYGENRQSVYDSRTHHSRVGAKFAKKSRSR